MPKKVVNVKVVDTKGQKNFLVKPSKSMGKIVSKPLPKKITPPLRTILKTPRIWDAQKNPIKEAQKVEGENLEKILVENFVLLQKVMVNLSVKMDDLTNQVSKLLNLFEISAKSLAEKGANFGGGYEKRMMEKIDGIVDQNKTLARGISLLHESQAPNQNFVPPQSTSFQIRQPIQGQKQSSVSPSSKETEGYQQSISSKPQSFNKLPQG